MAHHIFQSESELQNVPEAALKASPSFSISEKLAQYGSSALSGVEHLFHLDFEPQAGGRVFGQVNAQRLESVSLTDLHEINDPAGRQIFPGSRHLGNGSNSVVINRPPPLSRSAAAR
jgi:hypothetical protein